MHKDFPTSKVMQNSLIMMVDDEPIMLDLIQMFLDEYGYKHFFGVSDSTLALQEINTRQPDALLLDLVMPNVSGFEILEKLRKNPETQHLPVIVLTSSTSNETMLKALELGATDFLAKPVDQSELALRLRNTLTFKAYQDRLKFFDELTGLPNRTKFQEHLKEVTSAEFQGEKCFSIIVVRILRIDDMTQTFGTSFRDAVVTKTANMLSSCLRSSDMVSHCGNISSDSITALTKRDEFSILLTRIHDNRDAGKVCERITKYFSMPVAINEQEVFISIGLGISLYPDDGHSPEQLISQAEFAASKVMPNNGLEYQFYSEQANTQMHRSTQLKQELRKAIINQDFHLVYQPQIDAVTNQVKGAEALLRWIHKELGFISPAEFIPIAEDAGLMNDIGNLVIHSATKQLVSWEAEGITDLSISINVSGQQFNSSNFVENIETIIRESKANPKNIVLEITESLSMNDIDITLLVLHRLKQLNLRISVDDFGTGHSSLSYLKNFPINELKIDKAFIDGLPNDNGDKAIVSAIITIAKAMDYTLVAEGVEHHVQYEYLREIGCDLIQGYYFSKPLEPKDFKVFYLNPCS